MHYFVKVPCTGLPHRKEPILLFLRCFVPGAREGAGRAMEASCAKLSHGFISQGYFTSAFQGFLKLQNFLYMECI